MAMVRCPADEHHYDDSKHSSCPHCTKILNGGYRNMNNRKPEDKTIQVNQKKPTAESEKKTVMRDEGSAGVVKPNHPTQDSSEPKTTAPWMNNSTKDTRKEKETKHTYLAFGETSPVTGWLVIVEGENKGKDFRIIPGINTIGRSKDNTIIIDSDSSISRGRHCLIEYDYKNGKFYIEKETNSVYLNGDRVGGNGSELTINDIIEIGKTKLKFIPFCNSEFCWEL